MPPLPLTIEKLVYGGEGLARLAADSKGRRMAVFVPFTLPGEQVEAALGQVKGGMARAELVRVLEPSPQRESPRCPYFGTCGGCHLQHGSYDLQLEAKRSILRETLERARLDIPVEIATLSAEPWHYRNRIRLHVRTSPGWQMGYLERRSHRFLAVEMCPIASPLLERAIGLLATPDIAALAPPGLSELEMFCNHDSSQMTFTAYTSKAEGDFTSGFGEWIDACQRALPELRGAIALGERSAGGEPETLARIGEHWLTYRVGAHDYRVSAGSFFQVNLPLLPALAERVVQAANAMEGSKVLDLYAGVGLFSLPLAASGAKVTAAEVSKSSATDLATNLLPFGNAKTVQATTESFLARVTQPYDAIVVDPPRAGLGIEVTRQLVRIAAPRLVYLSCDPTTLARDLQILLAGGYAVDSFTLVDLFPQTFHLETCVVLRHN
jgi:23S rRNA (uracil1939-C5)-methyltransferase